MPKREPRGIRLVPSVLPDLCTGCDACVTACALAREKTGAPSLSRVRVRRRGEAAAFQPVLCLQCIAPPCAAACPAGAREADPGTGFVRLRSERCIGCGACIEACPAGAVWMRPDGSLPLHCDACGGSPACVAACAPGALRFLPPLDAANRSRLPRRARLAEVFRTRPRIDLPRGAK